MNWDVQASIERCKRYRRRILEISQQVTALHVAPAFSCMEIVDVIYHGFLRRHPLDCFIMSKGHGCLAQYVVLEDWGVLPRWELDNYCKPGGHLGAHPDYGTPGIMASTGSLGHGLSIAVGLAHAIRVQRLPYRVYCLLSDGEMQEGSTWEAMMMAANFGLNNLTVMVDNNDYGGLAKISEHHEAFYPLTDKAEAFGWLATRIGGHMTDWLYDAILDLSKDGLRLPQFIQCETVKGYPISFMRDSPIWHYRSPNKEELEQALRELS